MDLKSYLESRNEKIIDFAKRCEVHPHDIYRYLNLGYDPGAACTYKIIKGSRFNVSLEDFVKNIVDRKRKVIKREGVVYGRPRKKKHQVELCHE